MKRIVRFSDWESGSIKLTREAFLPLWWPDEPQCAEALRKAMREVLVKAGNDDMMSIVKVARVTLSETSPEPGTPFKVKAPSSAVFVLGTKSASVNG